jgi:hypothetical protein
MDPDQVNHMAGAVAGMMGFFMLLGLTIVAFHVFVFWRIFTKAGLSGPLALIGLIPPIGWIIVLCILAFSDWKVIPSPYRGLQPYPPPPTNYQPPLSTTYNPPATPPHP